MGILNPGLQDSILKIIHPVRFCVFFMANEFPGAIYSVTVFFHRFPNFYLKNSALRIFTGTVLSSKSAEVEEVGGQQKQNSPLVEAKRQETPKLSKERRKQI